MGALLDLPVDFLNPSSLLPQKYKVNNLPACADQLVQLEIAFPSGVQGVYALRVHQIFNPDLYETAREFLASKLCHDVTL